MTGHVLPFDTSAHAAVDALLPFYVNGTLRGDELAFVEQHIDVCEKCQREAAWLQDVFAACADVAPVQEAATAGSRPRINPARPVPGWRWPVRFPDGWRAGQPWVRGLLAAQLAAIAVLGTLIVTDSRNEAIYHTLGASNRSTQSRDAIAVIFDPLITESELRRVVSAVGARIVDGPTATNAWLLEVPATKLDETVQLLRAEPNVRFAERLGGGTGP